MKEPLEFILPLEHKNYTIRVTQDCSLELWLDNCLRKRDSTDEPVLYVWTNIELYWENHRWVEARFRKEDGRLHVTVDGSTVLEENLSFY